MLSGIKFIAFGIIHIYKAAQVYKAYFLWTRTESQRNYNSLVGTAKGTVALIL